jgi:hypothetical protein
VGCGGETASWGVMLFNDEAKLELGEYNVSIAFTNSGAPVQANWDYRFAITYDF